MLTILHGRVMGNTKKEEMGQDRKEAQKLSSDTV